MWQRLRQELLKSPTAVVRAHRRPPRDRAGLAPLVLAGLAAEAMEVEDSAPMAAEGLAEDVDAVSAVRGVNARAKVKRNLSVRTGKPRN